MHRYLGALEKALAQHVLRELAALGNLSGRDPRSLEALYRQAYAVVARLRPAQVARIAGERGRAALRVVRGCRRKMLSDSLPQRLRANPDLHVLPVFRTASGRRCAASKEAATIDRS